EAADRTPDVTASIRTVEVDPAGATPAPVVTASLSVPPSTEEAGTAEAEGFFTRASLAAGPASEVAEEKPDATALARATTAVNVRAGPSSSTAKLFVLEAGESVRALSRNGGWIEVVSASG